MEQQVMYKYSKMELEQFAIFEENYQVGTTDVQFQTEAQFSYDMEHFVLCSKIIVNMMNIEKKPLLKAELKSYFDLQPESVEGLRQDGRIIFAPPLLVQFASFCYGAMRGVLFTKTSDSPLNKFILPPVYFGNIIDKSFAVQDR